MASPSVTETQTLALLRDVLASAETAEITPQTLKNVWAFPEDKDLIQVQKTTDMPVGIVLKALDQEQRWSVQATGTLGKVAHLWTAEFLLLLRYGPPESAAEMAEYLEMAEPWLWAISEVLSANRDLGSEYILLGSWNGRNGDVMLPMQGGIFWDNRQYMGFRILIPVRHRHTQEMR